jgi:hypothetical protein
MCPIAINVMTYCLIAHTLVIQLRDTFAKHFTFHQFVVTTHGECETMVHNV